MPGTITEDQLIEAMRDPRYWNQNHPERLAHIERVTKGWEELYSGSAGDRTGGGLVHVREHTRGNGEATVNVSAYDRRAGSDSSLSEPTKSVSSARYDLIASKRELACERQLTVDRLRCYALGSMQAQAVCLGTAMERYSQCLVGRPIQDLFQGW